MRLWRVSTAVTLDEASRQEKAGRWHYAGSHVLYLSATPELATLEALVHHRVGMTGYRLASIALPRNVRIHTVPLDDLPADWRERKPMTRRFGDAWLRAAREPVLAMPSAVVPVSFNYLLNPEHPKLAGRLRMRDEGPWRFDRRLVDRAMR
jgi:RES domain-containing protein